MLPLELVKYKKNSQKIIALTAWDCITGSLAEESGASIPEFLKLRQNKKDIG